MNKESETPSVGVQNNDQSGKLDDLSDKMGDAGIQQSDGASADASESKPQMQQGGKRGKKGKRQKFVPLDLSKIPDSPPVASVTTREGGNSNPSQANQSNSSPWAGNRDSATYHSSGQSQSHGNQGGRSSGGYQQSYGSSGSGQRYGQSQDYGYRERGSNVALSKAIVTLLRHGKPRDIKLDGGGYALVDDIVRHPQFQRFDVTQRAIKKLVDDDTKRRYELVSAEGGGYKIRATQGHSVQLEAARSGLIPLTDPKKHGVIVHGTYQKNWSFIKKQGLNRMTRTYIHFAIGYIGETHVTSGMRNTCDVTIELDLEKAIKDGLRFFESANGVVLCEGDKNGNISPKYFKIVRKYDYKADQFKDINFKYEDI